MQKVKVEIFGEQYTIRGDAEPDYIVQLANYVDGKMREIADSLKTTDTKKIAILSALNIADELLQKQNSSDPEAEAKTRRLISLLDEGLIGDFY